MSDSANNSVTGRRYKHPFTVDRGWVYYSDDQNDPTDKDTPRTLVELRMCALSSAMRAKHEWWVKFRDEKVREKWTEEIKEQQKDMHRSLQLTNNMINYVMGELEAYAALRDPETGVEAGPYERIWLSDKLIPETLREDLLSAVALLESVPDAEKDWHPGSNGQVLDLVHPAASLWPVVYKRTVDRASLKPLQPRKLNTDAMFRSERFQWLPSDFTSKTMALAGAVTSVLEKAVPMFEWVLSDLERETPVPTRLDLKGRKFPDCIWPERCEPEIRGKLLVTWQWRDEFLNNAANHLWPDSLSSYSGGLDGVKKTVSLRGRTLQVIVKLANIVLEPGATPYEGGSWHVEGTDNGAIVSTFIYYYDTENITESTLSFRNDTTNPGHRKILVLFLVDPNVRIPSATDVAPQQEPWLRRPAEGATLWARLPSELHKMVWAAVDVITREQAEKYREELMEERREVVKTVDGQRFGRSFNLCEH